MKYFLSICFLFVLSSTICAQEITVFPTTFSEHYYVDSERVGKGDIDELMEEHAESLELWNSYKKNNNIALGLGIVNVGLFIWFINDVSRFIPVGSDREFLFPLIATVTTSIVSFIFQSQSRNNKRDAILSYNSQFDVSYGLGITPNGLGMVVTF